MSEQKLLHCKQKDKRKEHRDSPFHNFDRFLAVGGPCAKAHNLQNESADKENERDSKHGACKQIEKSKKLCRRGNHDLQKRVEIVGAKKRIAEHADDAPYGKHNKKREEPPEYGSAQFLHACRGARGAVAKQIVRDAPEVERERRAYQKRGTSAEESCDPRSEAGEILRRFAGRGRCGFPTCNFRSLHRRSSLATKGNLHELHDTENREHDKNGDEPPYHEHRGLFLFRSTLCAEKIPEEPPEKRNNRNADQNGEREVDKISCDRDQTIKPLRLRCKWQRECHRRCRRAKNSRAHHRRLAGNLRDGRTDKICEKPRAEHETCTNDHVEKIPLGDFEFFRIPPRHNKIESCQHDKKGNDGQHDEDKYLERLFNELAEGAHAEWIR